MAGRASGSTSRVGGDGLEKGFMNMPVDFWLKTADGAGNPLTKGGEKVGVSVKGPGHNDVVVKVHDRKDGSYALKLVPPAAGLYTLTVRMGREVVGAPISLTVYRSPTAAAAQLKLHLGVPPINAAAAPASARGHAPPGSTSARRRR